MHLNNRSRRNALEYLKKHPDSSISKLAKGANVSRNLAASILKEHRGEKPAHAQPEPREEAPPPVEGGEDFTKQFPAEKPPPSPDASTGDSPPAAEPTARRVRLHLR